jgi:hypothetical protein
MKNNKIFIILILIFSLIYSVKATSVITFYDDFEDNEINTTLWVNAGCTEEGGKLTCGTTYPDADNKWIRSVNLTTLGITGNNYYDLEIRFSFL